MRACDGKAEYRGKGKAQNTFQDGKGEQRERISGDILCAPDRRGKHPHEKGAVPVGRDEHPEKERKKTTCRKRPYRGRDFRGEIDPAFPVCRKTKWKRTASAPRGKPKEKSSVSGSRSNSFTFLREKIECSHAVTSSSVSARNASSKEAAPVWRTMSSAEPSATSLPSFIMPILSDKRLGLFQIMGSEDDGHFLPVGGNMCP